VFGVLAESLEILTPRPVAADLGGFYLLITLLEGKLCSDERSDRNRGGCVRIG